MPKGGFANLVDCLGWLRSAGRWPERPKSGLDRSHPGARKGAAAGGEDHISSTSSDGSTPAPRLTGPIAAVSLSRSGTVLHKPPDRAIAVNDLGLWVSDAGVRSHGPRHCRCGAIEGARCHSQGLKNHGVCPLSEICAGCALDQEFYKRVSRIGVPKGGSRGCLQTHGGAVGSCKDLGERRNSTPRRGTVATLPEIGLQCG